MIAVLVLLGVAIGQAATPTRVIAANRALALKNGDQLLDALSLPSDAIVVAKQPGGRDSELARSFGALWYRAEVDRVRYWLTKVTPSQAAAVVAAHLPAGAVADGRSWSIGSNTATLEAWTLPSVQGPRLRERLLSVSAVSVDSQTGVRADAWVQYSAPRLASQRIPSKSRLLDITVQRPQAAKALQSLQITKRSVIKRIAAVIDGLPFLGGPPGATSCPGVLESTPVDTFRFRASPTGRALATVSMSADTPDSAFACYPTSLWVLGHSQPLIAEGGVLLKKASEILHVKLMNPPLSP